MPLRLEQLLHRLRNALKHACASEITVTVAVACLDERQHGLHVAIADNGTGIHADHPIGIGLHSMRERAEELGGSCTITGSENGTQVVAYLPIEYQENE